MLVLSHRSANYANQPAEANFAPKPSTGDEKCPNKCENVSQTGLCKHLRDSPVIPARHPIIQTRFTKSRGEGRTAWWGSTGGGWNSSDPHRKSSSWTCGQSASSVFWTETLLLLLTPLWHPPSSCRSLRQSHWWPCSGSHTLCPPPLEERKRAGVREVQTVCAVWEAACPI